MKSITIELNKENVDYIQRLGFEVDNRIYIIDRMFDNHKDDTDTKMFDSVPFKKYSNEVVRLKTEFDIAVKQLGDEVIKPLVEEKLNKKDVDFTWNIPDFNDPKAIITLED